MNEAYERDSGAETGASRTLCILRRLKRLGLRGSHCSGRLPAQRMRERASRIERERASSWLCVLVIPSLFERVASHAGLEAFGRVIPMMWVLQREASVALEAAGALLAKISCTPQFSRPIHCRSSRWSICSYVVSSTRWSTPESRAQSRRCIFARQPCLPAEIPWS